MEYTFSISIDFPGPICCLRRIFVCVQESSVGISTPLENVVVEDDDITFIYSSPGLSPDEEIALNNFVATFDPEECGALEDDELEVDDRAALDAHISKETTDHDGVYARTEDTIEAELESGVSDGEILVFDSETGKWVNKTIEEAGIGEDGELEISSEHPIDHDYDGLTIDLTAGENLVFGEVVFIQTDKKAYKADCDISTALPAMYMALESILSNNEGKFLVLGTVRDDSWNWLPGDVLYVSSVAGQMTQTKPDGDDKYIQALGIALSADNVDFRPIALLIQEEDD